MLELDIDARRQVGSIERQEADRSRKCLLWEASEKLGGRLREASNGRRSQRAKRKTALHNDQRHYVVDRGYRSHRRCRIDDDRRVATTAAPLTERRIATVANARRAMGMALATISLENGSPWLAAKKTATSVPLRHTPKGDDVIACESMSLIAKTRRHNSF